MKDYKEHKNLKEQMKKVKSPWDLKTVPYDQRSSIFVDAGDSHGVGHKQPIGHE